MRSIAARLFRGERSDHTLQPTAIVNDALMKLLGGNSISFENRAHFFAIAARTMRNLLIDHSRKVNADRRGGGDLKLELDDNLAAFPIDTDLLAALGDALEKLEAINERQAKVVEMRFFVGMTIQEVATTLGIGHTTVESEWKHAKAFLMHELDL